MTADAATIHASAVLIGAKAALIRGPAGSGKTTTVVQKLCYLLGAAVTDRLGVAHTIAQPLMLADVAATLPARRKKPRPQEPRAKYHVRETFPPLRGSRAAARRRLLEPLIKC